MERGADLIEESIGFGVTAMRAFVEVDHTVGMKCLEAGLALKERFKDRCYIQICVFAQDPIFTHDDGGLAIRAMLEEAVQRLGVEGRFSSRDRKSFPNERKPWAVHRMWKGDRQSIEDNFLGTRRITFTGPCQQR